MNKRFFILLLFALTLNTLLAQQRLDHSPRYSAGSKIIMQVDTPLNVYYGHIFPNQPNTYFNYLPDVHTIRILMYFPKTEAPENYRYSLLIDDEPMVVNKPIALADLKETNWKDDDWKDVRVDSTSLGTFPIHNKVITLLTYDVKKPQLIHKTVFYGKPLPKAILENIMKRKKTENGFDATHQLQPEAHIDLTFAEQEDQLTLVKEISEIDYIYEVSIHNEKTKEIIFKSNAWNYGGHLNEQGQLSPYVHFDRSLFKKSGDYVLVIQPMLPWDLYASNDFDKHTLSAKEIESYTARYTLSVTLDQEVYTKKELLLYAFIVALLLGSVFFLLFNSAKRRNKKQLAAKEQQKEMAKLQLDSIRAQLNPHFLFNALSGIQNLINKQEIDLANQYLTKFARLTRHVLDQKDWISLQEEKALLEDYLQMEQWRFGFQYEVNHEESLDINNIEIPSMLLQPFLENAVKHGIAQKWKDGNILISFHRQAQDLILTVRDNGNGFQANKAYQGLGLQLSRTRIELLNALNKENRIILDLHSSDKGTLVTLTLTEWL